MKNSKIVNRNQASTGIRFLNYVIDRLVIYLIFLSYGFVSALLYEYVGIDFFYDSVMWLDGLTKFEDILITACVYFTYMFSIEYFTKGRSIGKYITNTKSVSLDATTPTTHQFFIRNISRLVPFDALSFLGNSGWHDSWSNTSVITVKSYEKALQIDKEIDLIGTV